jgi:DNA-directed RNA polymerase specialized sigma24 family protein
MQETADILGVSYITVHRLLKRGLLKSSTALRHKLIPGSEIERFLQSTLE